MAFTLTPFGAHSLASALVSCADAPLRGGVGGHQDTALERQQRGDVDDPAAALGEHQLADPACQPERRREVHLEEQVPVVVGVVDRGRAPDQAGVVDEHVDATERPRRARDERRPARRDRTRSAASGSERRPSARICRAGLAPASSPAGVTERRRRRPAPAPWRWRCRSRPPAPVTSATFPSRSNQSSATGAASLLARFEPRAGAVEAGLNVDHAELAILDLAVGRHHPDEVDAVAGRRDVRVVARRASARRRRRAPG